MRSTFILLLVFKLSFAQTQMIRKLDGSIISATEIDKFVPKIMDAANIQGVAIAVLNEQKTVFLRTYGFRNKPKNELLDTASIMYGASLSKAVFGYLCMQLVQEKILDLDKPLYQYLKKPIPAYEYYADLQKDNRWKLITARMCLNHTTGLPNIRWFNPITSEEDTVGTLKIYFTPGTKYAYSGEGLKLLQLIIEEVTKKNVDELAVQRIFDPMGMKRTGYVWHPSFGDDNVAVGHLTNGQIDVKRKRTEPVSGGSMVTTIADYARFIEQVLQHKGLTNDLFLEMIRPQISIHSKTQFPPITYDSTSENDAIHLSYGLGWGVMECSFGKAFFKEGNGGAWRNYNINFIDKGISIIILVNSENGESIFQPLVETLIGETCIPWKWQGWVPYDQTSK